MNTAQAATRINAAHAAVTSTERDSLRHALVAGELLVGVKRRVGHGAFLDWMAAHLSFTPRTAQLYMALFRELSGMRNTVSHLTLRDGLRLIRQPAEGPWLRPLKRLTVVLEFETSSDKDRYWELLRQVSGVGAPVPVLLRALECYAEAQVFDTEPREGAA